MRPFWKRKTEGQAVPSIPNATDLDLLARQEDEAFVASVLRKRLERERQAALESLPVVPDFDEIEWSDQEDVYRPQRARASEFLSALSPERMPDLRRGSSCCLVRRAAFEKLQKHLSSDTRIELGGLLIGQSIYDADLDLYCVVVEEALPAHDGEGTAVTFAYTAATWQALTPQLQSLPATWTLLGSYHSHPGMGVFLSSTDMETQRGVFFHDWQIALVIDPLSHAVGFFFGAEGHPCSQWSLV